MIDIVSFEHLTTAQHDDAISILMRALVHVPSAYHTVEEARAEVERLSNEERLGLGAVCSGRLAGWIGAIRTYDKGWELHPLVVDPGFQRQGIGTALVRALEERARSENILTLYLGTDEDFAGTSLFGADLYPNLLASLSAIEPRGGHPLPSIGAWAFSLRASFLTSMARESRTF